MKLNDVTVGELDFERRLAETFHRVDTKGNRWVYASVDVIPTTFEK